MRNTNRDSLKRPLAVLALVIGATLGLVACGGGNAPGAASSTSAGSTDRTITTDQGNVAIPADPQRVVILSGGMAGDAFELGGKIVATDTRVLGVTDLKSQFPTTWADKAIEQGTVALPGGEQLNIEAVAAAKPDLIIGGGQGITAVQAEQAYADLTTIAPTVLLSTKMTGWQDQLNFMADVLNRKDKATELIAKYNDSLTQAKEAIKVPSGEFNVLLSLSTNSPSLIPGTSALPLQLKELGFTPSDTYTKAGKPQLYGSGDSFNISAEVLPKAADADTAFVINLGGKSVDELKADPVYAQLPAFAKGQVYTLPATSYRPDYQGAMDTLAKIKAQFP